MTKTAKEHIIVPVDVASEEEAIQLILTLKGHVGIFKIGLELLNSIGIGIVKKVTELGVDIFIDGKFNDIPNTVAGASRGLTRLSVKMFNVHTMGGLDMMKSSLKAAESEAAVMGKERPLILGVTVLTSIDEEIMNRELHIPGDVESQVVHLAKLADRAGLDGVIASPHEIEAIRRNVSGRMLIVTPGIRPKWSKRQDQRRTMSPEEAVYRGATYVVVGRPIRQPPQEVGTPVDAASLVAEEIRIGLERRGKQSC